MKKTLLCIITCAIAATTALAQKTVYIPDEWKYNTATYRESDPNNEAQYSKSRSKETDNFIVYWEKGYGNTAPNQVSDYNYYVDIDDLLQKCELYYEMNIERLKFTVPNSQVDKYKSIICILHTTEWNCYGGGYDFKCPALWINPSTCHPVGHSIAHEVGHSFQYMCYGDLSNGGSTLSGAGFHYPQGQGSGWWEQSAQWQANQYYPDLKWDQSWGVFPRSYNYAMTHEWHRYQSYWWHYYLAEKYGVDIIGRIWKHDAGLPIDNNGRTYDNTGFNPYSKDANEVLMDLLGIDSEELYRMYFDYAMKMTTFDLSIDNIRTEGQSRIGSYVYNYFTLGGTKHQVAYSSCPQSTGFNVIPLNVPEGGTEITTEFTSPKSYFKCHDDDPMEYLNGETVYAPLSGTQHYYNLVSNYAKLRGYRLGYVALLADGTRKYLYDDQVYCADDNTAGEKTVTLTKTVPEGTERLWLVVSPAPRQYIRHLWDDQIYSGGTNKQADDQWPYTVEFHGTNILGAPILSDDLPLTDAIITYDVTLPRSTSSYDGTSFTLDGQALSAIGTALQMQPTAIPSVLTEGKSTSPASLDDGKVYFYSVLPSTGKPLALGYSLNPGEVGYWFNANGMRTTWDNGYIFSHFYPESSYFLIGQKPGALSVGQTYTISQAMRCYRTVDKDGDGTAETRENGTVTFRFNITVASASTAPSARLTSVKQDEIIDVVTGITLPDVAEQGDGTSTGRTANAATYNMAGQRVDNTYKGLVIKNGKKILKK